MLPSCKARTDDINLGYPELEYHYQPTAYCPLLNRVSSILELDMEERPASYLAQVTCGLKNRLQEFAFCCTLAFACFATNCQKHRLHDALEDSPGMAGTEVRGRPVVVVGLHSHASSEDIASCVRSSEQVMQ